MANSVSDWQIALLETEAAPQVGRAMRKVLSTNEKPRDDVAGLQGMSLKVTLLHHVAVMQADWLLPASK